MRTPLANLNSAKAFVFAKKRKRLKLADGRIYLSSNMTLEEVAIRTKPSQTNESNLNGRSFESRIVPFLIATERQTGQRSGLFHAFQEMLPC